jgi:transcriptional regulator GlxA family with amidase domain
VTRHRVAVVVRDGIHLTQLGLVHHVFGQARAAGEPLYDVITCAVRPGPVRTDADVTVTPEHGLRALADASTIVVVSAHPGDLSDAPADPSLAAALARVHSGIRVASVCTGTFVLAAAGLLSGRRASVHPRMARLFRRRFRDVTLDTAP